MKMMYILLPVLLTGVSVSAIAETKKPAEIKKPVTEWSCAEFIALDDEYRGRTLCGHPACHRQQGR